MERHLTVEPQLRQDGSSRLSAVALAAHTCPQMLQRKARQPGDIIPAIIL
ncbi:MAG: hypothetical protein ACRD68_16945 [Pyrinomonadaceae bacterium]